MEDTRRGKVILIVDDEEAIVTILAKLLARRFPISTIHKAHRAQEGLRVLAEHDVDVVICDFTMPGMDGIAFLSQAKQASPTTMRILLTGHTDMDVAIRSVNEGHVHAYIQKPLTAKAFLDLVARLLEVGEQARNERLSLARSLNPPQSTPRGPDSPVDERDSSARNG